MRKLNDSRRLTPNNTKKRGARRARQNKYSGATRSVRGHPPQLRTNVMLSHTYRYTATSAQASTQFSTAALLLAAGCVGTVLNTTVTSVFQSVRVRRLSIYSPPASQGSFATCSVEWNGTVGSGTQEVSDTSNSVSQPAMISSAPPRNSLGGFWSSSVSNTALFTIICPAGSIIDLSLDLIMSDDETANPTRAVATAVLGTTYYLALDNGAGTHNLVPVSLTTTF